MIEVPIPKLGMSTVEVDIVEVNVAPGQRVSAGDVLLTVESEKTSAKIEAPAAGTISEVLVAEGGTGNVGDIVCVIDGEGTVSDPGP